MKPSFIKAYKELMECVTKVTKEVQNGVSELQATPEEQKDDETVDCIHALRSITDMTESLHKSLRKIMTYYEEQFVIKTALDYKDGKMIRTTIRTDWTTATVKCEPHVPIPKKNGDTEAYFQLCEYFGFSEDVARTGSVDFSWNGLAECLHNRMTRGEPVPEQFRTDNVYYLKKVTIRKKKKLEDYI